MVQVLGISNIIIFIGVQLVKDASRYLAYFLLKTAPWPKKCHHIHVIWDGCDQLHLQSRLTLAFGYETNKVPLQLSIAAFIYQERIRMGS